MESSDQLPKKILRSVITSKGSRYDYLPDGRTQRFKTVTGELNDPQDLLVFIPSFDIVKAKVLELHPNIFTGIENEAQFEALLLEYVQLEGKGVRPVDTKGIEVQTNSEARQAERVFLYFEDKENPSNSFFLPVSIDPKPGYYSFDTRKFLNEKGETMRERHMGNRVVKVNFEAPKNSVSLPMH